MMEPQEVIAEFNRWNRPGNTGDLLFIRKLREGGLTDAQIAVVIDAMDTICNECWDSEEPCWCSPGYDE